MASFPSASGPKWLLRPVNLDRIAFGLTLVAAAAQVVLVIVGASSAGLIGLAVTLLGALVSRRFTWPGLIVIVLGPLIDTAMGTQVLASWAMAVFMAFSVTVRGIPPLWVGALVGIPAYWSIVASEDLGLVNPAAFATMSFAFLAAAAGSAVRSHAQYWSELEQRTRDALATRESEANRRVVEERLRIARDLHDVVGHEIAVLNMHLGVAEVSLPQDAESTRSAIDDARVSIQAILQETQHILLVLRANDAEDSDALRPSPNFAGISELVRAFRSAGLDVDARIPASVTGLDPAVSTAAYRVVQEALTNAQRHGHGPARLVITDSERIVTISVRNTPRRPIGSPESQPESAPGFGLVGMRERVISAGGQLEVDDGAEEFSVRATMRADGGSVR